MDSPSRPAANRRKWSEVRRSKTPTPAETAANRHRFRPPYGWSWLEWLRPKFLWSEVYRGLEVGSLWLGWTNPVYKKRGW